jgi:hypothetical protein
VHSRQERQIQLIEEGIVEITSLKDLLIQGQQLSIDHM